MKTTLSTAKMGFLFLISAHIIFSINFTVVKYLTDFFSVTQLMLFRF